MQSFVIFLLLSALSGVLFTTVFLKQKFPDLIILKDIKELKQKIKQMYFEMTIINIVPVIFLVLSFVHRNSIQHLPIPPFILICSLVFVLGLSDLSFKFFKLLKKHNEYPHKNELISIYKKGVIIVCLFSVISILFLFFN